MSDKIYVVGKTSPREIFIACTKRPFIVDEYLKIHDVSHFEPIGEVIETYAYPKIEEDTFPKESGIYESMSSIGLLEKEGVIYVAKVKMLEELQTPVTPLSTVSEPDFSDIENLFIQKEPSKGFTLGVIRGTEHMQEQLPSTLNQIAPLFDAEKGVVSQKGIPFILDYYALREYPHIALFGGSGSGKTFGLRVICEEIMRKKIPGIVFDPHFELSFQKQMDGLPEEYVENFSKQHELFQLGENVGINFSELNTGELINLLEFVSTLTEPMKSALEHIHQRNDSFTTLINRVETLIQAFKYNELSLHEKRNEDELPEETIILYERYKNKIAGLPTLQALSWRLGQLEQTGIFNSDIGKIESCLLKRRLAVIRGKRIHLLMLSSYLIGKTYGKRRMYKDWEQATIHQDVKGYVPPKFPPFFVIMDESHMFAPNGNSSTPTKRILRELSQEARKYGVFLVLGTQRPASLDTTIVSQMNTKVIFRTNNEADMNTIRTEANLNEAQMKRLPDLSSGNAFISSATLDKPFYIRFRATKTVSPHASHPFDELDDFDSTSKLQQVLLEHLPLGSMTLPKKHKDINNAMGKSIPLKEIYSALDDLADEGKIKKNASPLGNNYESL